MHTTEPGESPQDTVKAELLKLHLAEYQALMSRANQFMSFQIGVWGLMITLLTLAVNQWRETTPRDPAIVWLAGIGAQILLHLGSTLLEQQYLLVTYTENKLRDAVVAALPEKWAATSFWRYESFLVDERPRAGANAWGEWAISVPVALLLIGAATQWWPTTNGTFLLFFLNVLLAIGLLIRTPHRIELRRTFATAFRLNRNRDVTSP
jgi:hypothetical protein